MTAGPIRGPRNLVVCCDGTGNVWKPGPGKTNVVKLVESLIRDPDRQLHYYDPGVGTPDGYVSEAGQAFRDIIRRVGGLVWGEGVWTNVAGAYAFLVHNYHRGDRIYFFGFSRGAFTARATAALVDMFGVLRKEHENLIPTLLKVYRSKPKSKADALSQSSGADQTGAGIESISRTDTGSKSSSVPQNRTRRDIGESLRDVFSHAERTPVHFIGVWDTVESVGLTQLALGSNITSEPTVKPAYRHVRHALALDELRWPYEPRLYVDPKLPDDSRSFKQVWFAGAHSDVGGGYAEGGVANAALHWMLREASKFELLIDFDMVDTCPINMLDTLHNETAKLPLWVTVGAFKRTYPEGMCVHDSVIERMNAGGTRYAPRLPANHTTERTSADFVDASGTTVRRPPSRENPQVLGKPVKDGWRPWHIAWLIASALATWWALSRYRADELMLASMQFFDGMAGTLYRTITAWHPVSGQTVGELLRSDILAIACYATLLPILTFVLLRLAGREGAAPPLLGKVFRYTAFLPAADLVEDFFTWVTLHHQAWGPFWSDVTFGASLAKFALLAAFVGTAICCVLSWLMRRWGQPGPVARPAT